MTCLRPWGSSRIASFLNANILRTLVYSRWGLLVSKVCPVVHLREYGRMFKHCKIDLHVCHLSGFLSVPGSIRSEVSNDNLQRSAQGQVRPKHQKGRRVRESMPTNGCRVVSAVFGRGHRAARSQEGRTCRDRPGRGRRRRQPHHGSSRWQELRWQC